jgi:hypothetical protein
VLRFKIAILNKNLSGFLKIKKQQLIWLVAVPSARIMVFGHAGIV